MLVRTNRRYMEGCHLTHIAHTVLDPTQPARIVFMGTPDFAVPTLRALVSERAGGAWPGGIRVVGVVTRPDKPAGRGRHIVFSPVKEAALEVGVQTLQPGPLRRQEAFEAIASLAPHLIVVAAFGQILPPIILDLPVRGCVNVHASLLPRWRGASPISAAISAGDAETGVTIMAMDEGLDTGAIITASALPIKGADTTGSLTSRLADLGARLLIDTLPTWLAGTASQSSQDDQHATFTRPLRKEDGRLDWTQPAVVLERQARAMSPWPGAFSTWNGALLKTLEVEVVPEASQGEPGSCYVTSGGSLACACGQGALALRVIQLEGKRAMSSAEALRGRPALASAILGT